MIKFNINKFIKDGTKPIKLKTFKSKKFKIRSLSSFNKTFREKGKEFENKVRRDLRKKGYSVSNAQNRHYDWLAQKGNKKYAVECKCNKASFANDEVSFALKCKKNNLIYMRAMKNFNGRIKYIK